MLLEQYRQQRPMLEQIEKEAFQLLSQAIHEQHVEISSIEHRVKTEESLAGKLELKGDKYQTINDITDLVGIRIITFYTDDVDKVAVIVKQLFKVDWRNSVDKRKVHQLNSFGYNSLHYICSLRTDDEQMRNVRFEIQMRTALQHVWSAIEHDIGYKGAVRLPPEYRRQFSRLAGMLELADDEFSRLRTTMTDYRRQVQTLVKSGRLTEVPLSTDSFRSYLELQPFERLNRRIAAVNQAELFHSPMMPFLPIMEEFGMQTLGDIQNFIDQNAEDAYQLALSQLAITDLDILADSVALQNLCIVHVLKQNKGIDGVRFIYDTLNGKNEYNEMLAQSVIQQAQTLPFMQK
jgi:ppGpp synthetase/RelA/SpoT-type nucleotidyltranferase